MIYVYRNGRRIILLLISLLLCGCHTIAALPEAEHFAPKIPEAESPAPPAEEKPPVKVDVLSPEWQAMSNEEKTAACQIPENSLRVMSTEDLLDAVIDYPLLLNIFVYDDIRDVSGIWSVYYHFNGLRELTEGSAPFSPISQAPCIP